MFRKISISTKITALVLLIVITTVSLVSYTSYSETKKSVQERFSENLHLVSEGRANQISARLNNLKSIINFAQISGIRDLDPSKVYLEVSEDSLTINHIDKDIESYLTRIKEQYNFKSVSLVSATGKVVFSTKPWEKFQILDGYFLQNALEENTLSLLQQDEESYYFGGPIDHKNGDISVLVIEFNSNLINDLVTDPQGLGTTGECLIARSQDGEIIFQVPYRGDSLLPASIPFDSSNRARPMKMALNGKAGSGASKDYKGLESYAVWTPIPDSDIGLVAKVNIAEIEEKSSELLLSYLTTGLIVGLIAIIFSILFSRFITKPIFKLKNTLGLMSSGELPSKIEKESRDELGEMVDSLSNVVESLRQTADFAKRIGQGELEATLKPKSDRDVLGHSLLSMRNNLVDAEKKDEERNWIVTGLAELGNILRMHDTIDGLGDDVVKYMVDRIGALQGALYVSVDDEVKNKSVQLTSLYAYNRKKYEKKEFKFAEGLIGQAVAEQKHIIRTEIPADYLSITSGLIGETEPDCILIMPLITEEKVYGVLEFAAFGKFEEIIIRFVEEVSVILARTVFNIKVNERTRKLLEESQKMSEDLQEKQESLRQNAEEMRATQDELERSNTRLNDQIEEVNRSQKRMQLLLENASEVITIYEEDQSIRYISPSVLPILGYSQTEMMGSSDVDKVHKDMTDEFNNMFSSLTDNPNEQVTIQYRYKAKSGKYIWIESTGTNFLSNPAINGFIVNSSDITERRRAEREQRMRSKMQALSENSPDLITRLENNKLSYINPIIEELTGKKPSEFLNKDVNTIDIDPIIIEKWLEIVEEISNSNQNVSTEMVFPSEEGDKIMQVNAIPEFDEQKNLESVLVVSHDITTRKLQEIEINNKNKKIADSINYAKRIQNAILPNNDVISRILPNSFIFYKPKDVVSGDFPWFAHVGNYVYIAAVDCTGHGVPGALLSLIGYFLLNDIVRSRKITDPGIILDQLDEGVTTTLKQDQGDNTAKDGMDIALCRLDLETNTVVFAGAHRPLYVMKNGEMEEIKGNKFAIGGGIYKNQTNFTSHEVQLEKGDSFYFCSDGYPDQFGGPDIKKFGPRRTRELIADIHELHLKEAGEVFDHTWNDWMGEEKQMDDVLLIGIKF